jgi:hypothetical protein
MVFDPNVTSMTAGARGDASTIECSQSKMERLAMGPVFFNDHRQ